MHDASETRQSDTMVVSLEEFRCILLSDDSMMQDALYYRIASAPPGSLRALLDETDTVGRNVLHVAAYRDNIRFFRVLSEKGADHNHRDDWGSTTLIHAALQGTEIVRYMLTELNCNDVNAQNHWGQSALYWGIQNPSTVKLLLEHAANPNIRDEYGVTPLMKAAQYDDPESLESAKLLWQYNADLTITDKNRWNALHYAAGHDSTRFLQWMVDIRAYGMMSVDSKVDDYPLDVATTPDVVDLLLHLYKNEISEEHGQDCLHWILSENNLICCKMTLYQVLTLLALVVSEQSDLIAAVDNNGALPLHNACRRRCAHIDVIEFLITQDPRTVYRRDSQGNLPFHTLCASKQLSEDRILELLNVFLVGHPNLAATADGMGALPLHIACRTWNESTDVIQFLVDKNPDAVYQNDDEGNLPFMVACLESASVDVLFFLMKYNPVLAVANFQPFSTTHVDRKKCPAGRSCSEPFAILQPLTSNLPRTERIVVVVVIVVLVAVVALRCFASSAVRLVLDR